MHVTPHGSMPRWQTMSPPFRLITPQCSPEQAKHEARIPTLDGLRDPGGKLISCDHRLAQNPRKLGMHLGGVRSRLLA
jgi:hypothetical protein